MDGFEKRREPLKPYSWSYGIPKVSVAEKAKKVNASQAPSIIILNVKII